jgi:hypothetical protein
MNQFIIDNIKKFQWDPKDERDRVLYVKNQVRLPHKVDNRHVCTPVLDQGPIGSCTAFATCAMLEYLMNWYDKNQSDEEKKQSLHVDVYSERFLYYVTRKDILKGDPTEDSGAYVRAALKAAAKFGVCKETWCRYGPDYWSQPGAAAYSNALDNQLISYAAVKPNHTDVRTMLSKGYPIVCAFNVYEGCMTNDAWVTGVMARSGRITGGHAIMLVGYDNHMRWYIFKNSWGVNFGDGGYGFLPYDFMENGDMRDLWVAYSMEDCARDGNIDVSNLHPLPEDVELVDPDDDENSVVGFCCNGGCIGKVFAGFWMMLTCCRGMKNSTVVLE